MDKLDKEQKLKRRQKILEELALLKKPFNPFQDKQDRGRNKKINQLRMELASIESEFAQEGEKIPKE